jgi:hypothetical protein
MALNRGAGHMPVLGFGTLIPDAAATISATRDALEAGFDTWSRYYTKYFRPCSRLLPRMSPGTLWSGFIATSRVSLSRLLIAAQSQNRCLPSPLGSSPKMLRSATRTASGLEADLRRCLTERQSHGRIDLFPLGADDSSGRLLIPENVYGRNREVNLVAAFDRVVVHGTAELRERYAFSNGR